MGKDNDVSTMWLTPEWMARGLRALCATVDSDSDLKRQMIEFMFETGMWNSKELTYSAAVSKFNNCLNPDRPEYFRTMHVWALMKRFGRFELFLAMADDLGFEVRHRATPEREQELLLRLADAYQETNRLLALTLTNVQHLHQAAPSLPVHPSFQRGTGSFSFEAPDTDLTNRRHDGDAAGGF